MRSAGFAVLVLFSCAVVVYCRLVLGVQVVSTHVVYLSVGLAGLWWGTWSLALAALFGALVLLLRLLTPVTEPLAADLLRVGCFLTVAVCIGLMSVRAARARMAAEGSRRGLEATRLRLAASERLASLGQLSAGVAHELNNPLGTVLMYSHVLLREAGADDPRRQDLEMIAGEATRCRDIIRGLLDFARESQVVKAPVDLGDLVRQLVAIMSGSARELGVELTARVEDGLPTVTVDAAKIRQMLINLVQNALDASSHGGHVSVEACHDRQGGAIAVRVADEGCGIEAANIDRIFTPFFTTKAPGRGTGLGLAVAYGAARAHSGSISVESKVGKGSVFTVTIPLDQDAQMATDSCGMDGAS